MEFAGLSYELSKPLEVAAHAGVPEDQL